jgi:putative sigma-54 modulation protein
MKVNVYRPPAEEAVAVVNDEIEDQNHQELIEQYRPHEVVLEETRPLKMLTTDEAIMKMDLSGDSFLIYRGEEDRMIKVIYRREDGNYGIIEPE